MKIKRWQLHVGYQVVLAIVFIIVIALQGCGTECDYFTRYVERFDRCVESPKCTFTFDEFYDYNVAVMRRDAVCKP